MNSDRLTYRPWDAARDAEAAFAIYGDPEVTRHIGGYTPTSVDEARAMLEKWTAATARYPEPYDVWAAELDGQVIGAALLKPLPVDGQISDEIEVGWHLGRPWWGAGFATEMGRTFLRHGFEELGLPEIHCVVEAPNAKSLAVARRLGLEPRGTTDRYYGKPLVHFSLTAEAWRRQ